MHAKFGMSKEDFENALETKNYSMLEENLERNADNQKISEGEFLHYQKWLYETAAMNGCKQG